MVTWNTLPKDVIGRDGLSPYEVWSLSRLGEDDKDISKFTEMGLLDDDGLTDKGKDVMKNSWCILLCIELAYNNEFDFDAYMKESDGSWSDAELVRRIAVRYAENGIDKDLWRKNLSDDVDYNVEIVRDLLSDYDVELP